MVTKAKQSKAKGRLRSTDARARVPHWPAPGPVAPPPAPLPPSLAAIRQETGWGQTGAPTPRVRLARLAVREATRLQMRWLGTERHKRLCGFAALASGGAAATPGAAAGTIAGGAGPPAPGGAAAGGPGLAGGAAAGAAAATPQATLAAAGVAARAASGRAAGATARGAAGTGAGAGAGTSGDVATAAAGEAPASEGAAAEAAGTAAAATAAAATAEAAATAAAPAGLAAAAPAADPAPPGAATAVAAPGAPLASPTAAGVAATGAAATAPSADLADAAATQLLKSTFARLWALKWLNARKETYWLLAFDGLPTPSRLHIQRPCVCGAGGASPGRDHVYWDCVVASAVHKLIQQQLPASAGILARRHVWLCEPPPGLLPEAWGVVCLAAVAAMDRGRAVAYRRQLDSRAAGGREVGGGGRRGGRGSSGGRDAGGDDGGNGLRQRTLFEAWDGGLTEAERAEWDRASWEQVNLQEQQQQQQQQQHQQQQQQQQQQQPAAGAAVARTPTWPADAGADVDAACGAACSQFELLLREFCIIGAPGTKKGKDGGLPWPQRIPAGHPFMRWDAAAERIAFVPLI